jgi:hypothetical protein
MDTAQTIHNGPIVTSQFQRHEHFYEINADSHYDCGRQLGVLFARDLEIQIGQASFTKEQREWAAGVLKETEVLFGDLT